MQMPHISSKLKALKLEMSENLLVYFVFISLPAQYNQFKVSYNTQKDKWALNELISHSVQEEERLKRERIESANLASASKDRKRKRGKEIAARTSQHIRCKETGLGVYLLLLQEARHRKKECPKYVDWDAKKGMLHTLVCSKVNLASVPRHAW